MNWLSKKVEPEALPVNMTLEELLSELARFGKPRLSLLGTGWHCNIEMIVSQVGAQFEVRSDFGMPAPMEAAKQCHDRVIQALRTLGK